MTTIYQEPDFGTKPNLYGLDSTSKVILSFSTGTSVVGVGLDKNYYEPVGISDKFQEHEVTVVNTLARGTHPFDPVIGNYEFQVYAATVTGTVSVDLESSTYFTGSFARGDWLGTKKEDDGTYLLYYMDYANFDLYSVGGGTVDIRKVTITPSVGFTDTLITTIDFGGDYFWRFQLQNLYFKTERVMMGDRIGFVVDGKYYFSVINWDGTSVDRSIWYDIYTYTFDLETESLTTELVWEAPRGAGIYIGWLHGLESGQTWASSEMFAANGSDQAIMVKLAVKNGVLHWYSAYLLRDTNSALAETHILVDGTDTLIYTDTTLSIFSPGRWSVGTSLRYYNNNEYLFVANFPARTTPYPTPPPHRVSVGSSGGTSTTDDPTTLLYYNYFPFAHPSVSPSIVEYPTAGMLTGTVYYTVDPATGENLATYTIAGATTIYSIFPTLDTLTGRLYALVRIGGVDKIVEADVSTGAVVRTVVNAGGVSTTSAMNHGNWFIQWGGTFVYMDYLGNLLPTSFGQQMIFEQN